MDTAVWIVIYSFLILIVSVLGGLIPAVMPITHQRLQLLGSVIAGFILGTALLHMIPHAAMDLSPMALGGWTLAGLLAMFLLERFFTFHHHELAEPEDDPKHEHTHACDHPSEVNVDHAERNTTLSWTGVATGLVIHSLLAGLALGASITGDPNSSLPGIAVFLIIALHKPLDALTLIGLMRHGKASKLMMHLANAAFALVVPAGVGIFYLISTVSTADPHAISAPALAFAAGLFLCVALSDLLPELHFHSHDRLKLSTALLIGVALATAVAIAKHSTHGDHDHSGHGHGEHHESHDMAPIDHSGHDHSSHDDHGSHDHSGHDHSGHGH